jgi:hypothetical protein
VEALNPGGSLLATIDLPKEVHGELQMERLPPPPGEGERPPRLRGDGYDAIVAMLDVPRNYCRPGLQKHMAAASHTVTVAENALRGGRRDHSALLLATGPISLQQACELAARLDKSFVDVLELGHRAPFDRARKCLGVLQTRAQRQARVLAAIEQVAEAGGGHNQLDHNELGHAADHDATNAAELRAYLAANREFNGWLDAAAMEPDAEAKAQLLKERSLWGLEGHELDVDGRDSDLIESQLKKNPLLKGALKAPQDAESFLFLAKGKVSRQAHRRGPSPRHANQTYRRWQK